MSKKTIKWLIAATALVIAGSASFGAVMAIADWDFTKFSTIETETNEYEFSEDITNISIKTDTADITFFPSNITRTYVVCNEETNSKHTVNVKDGELKIEVYNTKKFYDYIGFNLFTPSITVYLPESEYGNLCIKTNTSDIDLTDSFRFKSILITSSTGDISNMASASELIKLEAGTGKIVAKGISAKQIELSCSTGMIEIDDITCENDAKINVSTGKTVVRNLKCSNLINDGTTGDALLDNVIASGRFEITRSTGDVTLNNCDANDIYIETGTGDVSGTLITEKVFITTTSTGDVNVPKSTSGGMCEITTGTGDIDISIK